MFQRAQQGRLACSLGSTTHLALASVQWCCGHPPITVWRGPVDPEAQPHCRPGPPLSWSCPWQTCLRVPIAGPVGHSMVTAAPSLVSGQLVSLTTASTYLLVTWADPPWHGQHTDPSYVGETASGCGCLVHW